MELNDQLIIMYVARPGALLIMHSILLRVASSHGSIFFDSALSSLLFVCLLSDLTLSRGGGVMHSLRSGLLLALFSLFSRFAFHSSEGIEEWLGTTLIFEQLHHLLG